MENKRGFTLGETLLALGIVGIVTAITITVFTQLTFKDRMAEQLKATYSQLSQAMMIMMAPTGSMVNVFNDDNTDNYHADSILNTFCNNMKCVRKCSYTEPLGNCWHNNNTWFRFDGTSSAWGSRSSAVLANGSLVFFEARRNDCTSTQHTEFPVCGNIRVDLNGFNPPNIMGRDIFMFWITADKLLPAGVSGDTVSLVTAPERGQQYTQKVLSEGAMNY